MTGGLFGAGCDIMPIPILFALPSSPMAIMVGICEGRGLMFDAFDVRVWRGDVPRWPRRNSYRLHIGLRLITC